MINNTKGYALPLSVSLLQTRHTRSKVALQRCLHSVPVSACISPPAHVAHVGRRGKSRDHAFTLQKKHKKNRCIFLCDYDTGACTHSFLSWRFTCRGGCRSSVATHVGHRRISQHDITSETAARSFVHVPPAVDCRPGLDYRRISGPVCRYLTFVSEETRSSFDSLTARK